ncbi:MAG: flagellar hook capping protein [Piscirickettsiaceae bacterium CG_4_9_14_3_um_filter_43_564]|nr:flagellar hook capping protein [Thiomicrospira sp.]OIP96623.1 MAG: flagellar hook capping protein [Thiomicrospira sp. CG2_30_44_34]PIQ06490.1 MAG: flagellar hook capping protein [Piscirickettsiaceae bacterium CG18_big_fil_WC_8_21_14_2_50_44_103]PIU39177.1 MAG: flagellar hook capping protein [Piscirickettsiaceae bacterium CG07_land_8_20_14_0_80_44_28]PIW78058.1 MAG: flagellar hook capping protein [Piscirickettsiaceae bacterium CG_4_8_14_3_um_filter_44_38]PIX78704.1 MAG: flagellar hook cappin
MATLPIDTQNQDYISSLQKTTDPKKNAPNQQLDQADFLRLLTTQLANQDPNKPMDPTNFVTDLTQMSQLESTNKMNESMLAMTNSLQSMQVMQSASLIGKNVQAVGDLLSHQQGTISDIKLDLKESLTDVNVVISNDSGPVQELFLDDLPAGEKIAQWDGIDKLGNVMPSDDYKLTVYGTNPSGDIKTIDTIVPSRINSIGINSDGSARATLATGEIVNVDEIREIS